MATSSNRQTFIRFYTDYPDTYFDKSEEIMEGSLSLEQTLIEGGLQFGVPCADKFECDLRNNFTVDRKTTIWVYQIIDNDSEHPYGLFFGKVDSMKMDALGYTNHLVAYDRFYFQRDKSVKKWWKKYWKDDTHDFTLKGIREALLTKKGFRFDDVTLFNDHREVYKPMQFKQITFGELLGQLCAVNACIPHIDSTGKVCFIQLSNTVAHTMTSDLFETENCEFDYFDTPVIDAVSVESSEFLVSSDDDDVNDAENIFPLPYNIFFDGKQESTLLNRANDFLNQISFITYRPCSVKMIQSDYSYKLGDKIQITVSRNGSPVTYYSYIFKNEFSGPLLIDQTFSCQGEPDYEVNTGANLPSKTNTVTDSSKQNCIVATENPGGVADGTTREILYFEFRANQEKSLVFLYTSINFEVETTVSAYDYKDCELTITLILDGTTVETLYETYGDGHQTFTLVYKLDNLTVGDHELTVVFAPVGGLIR